MCNGTALAPDLTVPAERVAETYHRSYSGIAVGSTCTVTETSDGATAPFTSIPSAAGRPSPSRRTVRPLPHDRFLLAGTRVAGGHEGHKRPGGRRPGTGHRSRRCDDGPVASFDIATRVTGPQSKTFRGIQAGSDCKVTETADGSTSTVDVIVTGDGQTVTVPADGTAAPPSSTRTPTPTAHYPSVRPSRAPGRASRARSLFRFLATVTAPDDFVIPAGQAAGTYTQDYRTSRPGPLHRPRDLRWQHQHFTVRQEGSGTEVTVPAGAEATVDLTDTLRVRGTGGQQDDHRGRGRFAGRGPHRRQLQRGRVETTQPSFVIPAGTPAGTVSMPYPNILAGSTCTLTETANGATETATATTTGSPQGVVISDNGSATANVTNQYEYVPGGLIVTKDIAGPPPASRARSPSVLAALNGETTSHDPFVIPAGQAAGTFLTPTKGSRPARLAP